MVFVVNVWSVLGALLAGYVLVSFLSVVTDRNGVLNVIPTLFWSALAVLFFYLGGVFVG